MKERGMVKVDRAIRMVQNMKVNTTMMSSKGTAYLAGQTDRYTRGPGSTASSKVRAN